MSGRVEALSLEDVGELGFEEFVAVEHHSLYSALCLITRDRYEAEDVMQEAFVRIWERWDRVRDMDDPQGYLYRTSLNIWRKRTRRAARAIRYAVRLERPDELSDVEGRVDVVRALSHVTPRQRAAVVLTDLLGYTSEEAGRALGIKPPTVRVLASKARATLRSELGGRDG